jgi:hypothetical protein
MLPLPSQWTYLPITNAKISHVLLKIFNTSKSQRRYLAEEMCFYCKINKIEIKDGKILCSGCHFEPKACHGPKCFPKKIEVILREKMSGGWLDKSEASQILKKILSGKLNDLSGATQEEVP